MIVLPSVTTIGFGPSTWRNKLQEIEELEVKEFALFLTGLNELERESLFYKLVTLRRNRRFSIPFVHAVSGMPERDYQFLMDGFGTERFNLHPVSEFPLVSPLSRKIRERIFIENSGSNSILSIRDIEEFGGVCLDLSHLRDLALLDPEALPIMEDFLRAAFIGANHISAVLPTASEGDIVKHHSSHIAYSASDFDYLITFPLNYFAKYCAIEVENPIREQILFKSKIELILQDKLALSKKAA